ncbi:MAG: M20 family metallopeptidase [Proteobacteria bacterium]|nr:M20 family metallopeptidase [Pseudomonadota bacterium]MDA0862100.1 M20 family metallopeptidase [Pseudomonadota bacterium]MDA1030140.1 M20 family metallopeptidase [Pseudomonadota bacterium]
MALGSVIELTKHLVQMNTINPPGDEEACARFLGDILEKAKFSVSLHPFGEKRASLVARIGGNSTKKPLCITGHIDTVPLGATAWTKDPFSGETDAGRLFGRGTSDMKCGVAAFVTAAIELSDRLSGTPGLELVITAGEEVGCQGAFDLVRQQGALGRAGAVLVGEPTSNFPFVGHKGAYWLTAKTSGVTAHGSMPNLGENAVYRAAKAITALENFKFSNPPHEMMGQATLNVGMVHGGLNINSVPDEAAISIDIRSVPTSKHKDVRDQLQKCMGHDVELETFIDLESIYSEPDTPWIQTVFDLVQPYLGYRPEAKVATYFTDAAALTPAYGSPPTLILGPGEASMAHQTDEYCVLDRVEASVDMYKDIISDWCEI